MGLLDGTEGIAPVESLLVRPLTDKEAHIGQAIIDGLMTMEGLTDSEAEAAFGVALAIYARHRQALPQRDMNAIARVAETATKILASGRIQFRSMAKIVAEKLQNGEKLL
ncbi:MAG: hypothetical protein HMLKMBBP_01502 [Planctomycetes bacterium]|nr:hypothetical protein [Planctomycetota bacterium]